MTHLNQFTDQQSRIDRAFSIVASSCTAYCEACGRTFFVTSQGHGDYDEGELERLHNLAEEQPDKYIEVSDFGSVSMMYLPDSRSHKNVVIGCLCDPTKWLSEFIEGYAEELTVRLEAARQKREADEALAALGWSQMECAPRDTTWIDVETTDGTICAAHWACDLSGEEQPPFEGWFTGEGQNGPFRQVHPIHWRPQCTNSGSTNQPVSAPPDAELDSSQ